MTHANNGNLPLIGYVLVSDVPSFAHSELFHLLQLYMLQTDVNEICSTIKSIYKYVIYAFSYDIEINQGRMHLFDRYRGQGNSPFWEKKVKT